MGENMGTLLDLDAIEAAVPDDGGADRADTLALVAEVRRLRAEGGELRVGIFSLTRELEAARAIVEGRTTGPTDAEIDAHAAVGGKWWVFAQWSRHGTEKAANIVNSFATGVAKYLRDGQPDARWWALDATWAPCAWPEVMK